MKSYRLKWLLPLCIATPPLVFAQSATTYPERSIRIIVPFAAGGVTDALVRLLQEPVGKALGQPIIVENKGGAAGAIGARLVAAAPPDGHTLLIVNTGLVAITPFVQKNAGFDALKSFVPVAGMSSAPSVLLVNPGVPAGNLKEFIAYAKTNPGKVEYAVVGKGAFGDLTTTMFANQAGIHMLPVAYQGNAQTTTALLSGEVKAQLTILSGAMNEYIRNGKIKALGVATLTPSPLVPGVTPIAETLPNFEAVVYTGLLAPAKTPPEIVEKISRAVMAALSTPEAKLRLSAMGMESVPLNSVAYGDRIKREIASFASVIKELPAE